MTLSDKILKLVANSQDMTQSDIQGVAMAIEFCYIDKEKVCQDLDKISATLEGSTFTHDTIQAIKKNLWKIK